LPHCRCQENKLKNIQQLPVYRAANSAQLKITPLDDLTLIYHRPSGMTHIVGEPVPQILIILDQMASNADDLMRKLSSEHDIADDGNMHNALAARLDELCITGLLSRS
jgi:PqqD family protein of HPr-rel-A system